jgi:hypothetical protein
MEINKGFEDLGAIFAARSQMKAKKPPAHEWQDLALQIIQELSVPGFKRNSIFKVCKDNDKIAVLRALNDTKELCKSGQKWAYFLKVIDVYQFGDKDEDKAKAGKPVQK